jgi:hypothetical protein
MTESQVQSILVKPADRQYHPWDMAVGLPIAQGTEPEWEKMWIGQKKIRLPFFWLEADHSPAFILVHFDVNGKVCNKYYSRGALIGIR